MNSKGTYSEDNPNKRTPEQNLNRKPDTRDFEHAPVQAQDGNFGEEQSEGVQMLGNEEQQFCFEQCIFQRYMLRSNIIIDVNSKAVIEPLRTMSAV